MLTHLPNTAASTQTFTHWKLLGVRQHRHIDSISNSLPEMQTGHCRFGAELRRPALLDLIADHVLALNWHEYGEGLLQDFTSECSIGRLPDTRHLTKGRNLFSHMV